MIIRVNKAIKKSAPIVKEQIEKSSVIAEEVVEEVKPVVKKEYKVTRKKKNETLLDNLNDLDMLLKSLEESENN